MECQRSASSNSSSPTGLSSVLPTARSTTAQFNLGKLLLRRRHPEPPRAGSTVRPRGGAAGDDVREAKGLLQKVIRDNEEHSGARLCLAHALAEEGGAKPMYLHCSWGYRGADFLADTKLTVLRAGSTCHKWAYSSTPL